MGNHYPAGCLGYPLPKWVRVQSKSGWLAEAQGVVWRWLAGWLAKMAPYLRVALKSAIGWLTI